MNTWIDPLREDRSVGRIILEALEDEDHPLHEKAREWVKGHGRPGVHRETVTIDADYFNRRGEE